MHVPTSSNIDKTNDQVQRLRSHVWSPSRSAMLTLPGITGEWAELYGTARTVNR